MKKLKITLLVFLCLGQCVYGYGLDWKMLHESADKLNISQAEELVGVNQSSLDSLYVLALVYLNEYKPDQAKAIFLKMLKINPQSIEAKWGMSEIQRSEYNLAESQTKLQEIIKADPEFSPAYITLAYLEFSLKNYKQAVRLADQVIRQGKENVDISNYTRAYLICAGAKGMLADTGGPIAKAVYGLQVFPNLKRARSLLPEFPGVYFGLGSFYLLAPAIAGGDIDKAEEYLKKTIELDPHIIDAYVRLGQVYQRQGDMENLKKYLRMALEKDPKNYLANEVETSLK
ncbi:MAG: tetratricopeptide repeat protein [Candidatus Omnitrophota bacterium]